MARLVTFIIMLIFWVLLSGMFDAFHLTLGVVSCLLVSLASHDFMFYGRPGKAWGKNMLGLFLYLPWLFYQIFLASIEIAYIVLHPRMLEIMDPRLVRFRTSLKTNLSRFTFAQSITLTPGTITVNMADNEFTVYALTKKAADSLPGEMEARVASALEGEK
ncbi:MAG: Na+/H+ antiporter subunit E [Deltaproteobacteria bacterium]|nr:Na+/H+ antiporter subunit E [Deltaproteobacteria bacterium]